MRRLVPPVLLASLALTPALAGDGPALEEGVTSAEYNQAGQGLLAGLKHMATAFKAGAPLHLEDVDATLTEPVTSWAEAPRACSLPGVQHVGYSPGEPLGADRAAVEALWSGVRERFAAIDLAAFKIVAVDAVEKGGRVRARIRFEATGWDTGGQRRTERARFHSTWRRTEERTLLTSLTLIGGERVSGSGELFTERASAWGIEHVGHEDPRFVPPSDALRYQVIRHAIGGASAGDADGDGWDDVLLTTGREAQVFLNQRDGTFRDATEALGLAGLLQANCAGFADFDNDGDQDLFVGRFYGQNLLYENRGPGQEPRFVDVTARSGLAADDMTAVLAAADFDGDGKLDLYLGRFLDARTEVPDMILYSRNGAPNRLYLGGGDLTFRDVSAGSGADDEGLTLGIAVADYDRDGDQDLYLTNDYGRNVLLRNEGGAKFKDVALESGALAISGGMSSSFGDYDNDGLLDIYVSSIRSNQRWFSQDVNIRQYVLNIVQSERRPRLQALFLDLRRHLGDDWDQVGDTSLAGNYLLKGRPDGTFEDVSDAADARPQGWYWSSGFFDVDNDGLLDIYAVNGWITGKKTDDL